MEHCAFEAPEEYHIDHTSFIKLQLIYFDEMPDREPLYLTDFIVT